MSEARPVAPPLAPRAPMACFAFSCWDGPEAGALRERDLDGHLAHVEAHWRSYVTAGPMREPGETAIIGSLFLLLAESETAAWEVMRGDPYVLNGQYARIEVKQFTPAIGLYPGGKIWASADSLRNRAAG